jgi:D-xylose transport system substrate-binding protein
MKFISMLKTFLLIISGIIIINSCKQDKPIKVGFSLGPVQERWEKDKNYLTEKIKKEGAEIIVKEAKQDEQTQDEQVNALLKAGVDVLIITPVNSETAAKYVKKAHEKGVKVIAYDRIIKNCDLDYYVSFDNIKVGELQAEYLTRLKPSGNYIILGGAMKDNNSALLRLGQMNVLQPLIDKGDIDIILDKNIANWSEEKAYEEINNYLEAENKKPDAIIASNDILANGAARALKKHGMGKDVLLSGQDALLEACQRIVKGTQTMTVYKFIESLTATTAKIAVSIAKDEPVMNTQITVNNGETMVPAILLPSMIAVNKNNIRMTIVADGYLDEEKIFGK